MSYRKAGTQRNEMSIDLQYVPQSCRKKNSVYQPHSCNIHQLYNSRILFAWIILSHVQFCLTMKKAARSIKTTIIFVCIFQSRKFSGGLDRVVRLAMGWTVRGSGPFGGAIFRSRPDRPRCPPSLLYKRCQAFRGVKAAVSVVVLAPRLQVDSHCGCRNMSWGDFHSCFIHTSLILLSIFTSRKDATLQKTSCAASIID